ncbi:uncharacterized protein V6R79_000336 [Siganus canaliculatus]
MSQVQVGGVDLCDNLPGPEALTAQTRNLNETNRLAQTSEKEDEGGRGLIQKKSVNNSREEIGDGQEKDGGGREEEEEEDLDEVMKEAEEEEASEGSNSFICCQSPDTPMTDSSYSETGSLLETPYPFSPGTSPEPTSPVIPVVSPETAYPISPVEPSQIDVKSDLHTSNAAAVASNTGSVSQDPTCTTRPKDSSTLTETSGVSPPGSASSTTDVTDRIAKNIPTEHFTSSAEPIYEHGSTCGEGVARSLTGPAAAAGGTTEINASGTTRESTESTSTTRPATSDWEQMASAWLSVSACTTGPTPSPALLESLEHLAQRGDDTHLPHRLHQIAEAFVLHKDYQQALCCLQLERLYHQRVLDNLNALQEQWESKCRRTSPNPETQHLDTLKHICQTHTRSVHQSVVCCSTSVSSCQTGAGMEQRVKGSSDYQSSHPVIASINLADRLKSPEVAEKDRGDPDRGGEGRDGFLGAQLTERQSSREEAAVAEGGVGYTIPAPGNELHPSSAEEMDQSEAAEQQGGAQEKEVKKEEEDGDVEEATEALEMEDDGEDEEEEKSLPVQTLVSGSEVEIQQLPQEPLTEENHQEQTQESATTRLHQDTEQKQQAEEEEEEEYDYEVEQADMIREAASLDAMAKLITVEEMSPASGLTSILKKRSVCTEDVGVSTISESRPDKPAAKRRVRFRVPDDSYEHDVGGADSCLLLFLLCLVTVVISVGGTALYCALGDAQSSVCQDFSRNADFYIGQVQQGISQLQHWFASGS